MKKVIYYSMILSIVLYCSCSCNTYIYSPSSAHSTLSTVPYGEMMAKQLLSQSDTVYIFNWDIMECPIHAEISYIWFHKDNHIHLFLLHEGRFKRYRRILAKNHAVDDTLAEYETVSMMEDKYGKCFAKTLDSTNLHIYTKNKEYLYIPVDNNCLQNEECEKGTFKYKLQYDLKKVLRSLKPHWHTTTKN